MTLELGVSAVQRALFVHHMANLENDAQKAEWMNHVGSWFQPLVQTWAYTGFRLFSSTGVSHCLNEALAAAGCAAISSQLGWVLVLTPVVTFIAAELAPQGALRERLQFAKNHLGTLLSVAMVVSQIAIYYFTQSHIALLSLAIQGILLLERNHLFPKRVSWVLRHGSGIALPLANLMSTKLLSLAGLFSAQNLVLAAIAPFIQKKVVQFNQNSWDDLAKAFDEDARNVSFKGKFTAEQLPWIRPDGRVTFAIHWEHLNRIALPSIPNGDVRNLAKLWDAVANEFNADDEDIRAKKDKFLLELDRMAQCDPLQDDGAELLRIIADALPDKPVDEQADFLWAFIAHEGAERRSYLQEKAISFLCEERELRVERKALCILQNLRTKLYYFPENPSWYTRAWLWLARRGMPNPLPWVGLKKAGNAWSTECLLWFGAPTLMDKREYTVQKISEYATAQLTPADRLAWKLRQPPEVQDALQGKSDEEVSRLMLVSFGVFHMNLEKTPS